MKGRAFYVFWAVALACCGFGVVTGLLDHNWATASWAATAGIWATAWFLLQRSFRCYMDTTRGLIDELEQVHFLIMRRINGSS